MEFVWVLFNTDRSHYIDTHIFIIYFEILSVGSILLIVFLIAVCCEAPQPIMDVTLYK